MKRKTEDRRLKSKGSLACESRMRNPFASLIAASRERLLGAANSSL
jgi:hypothetical protein